MKYINQCTDDQIKELMRCYAKNYTNIQIEKTDDCINITLINDGLPEYYTLTDYDVTVYDWDDTNTDCLQKFRDKMLLYFGNDYATNYLRNHI